MHWLEEKTKMSHSKITSQIFKSLITFTVLLILFPNFILAGTQLSENAKISVLTCGPGEPLYATFGHTALRVVDPDTDVDEVFNFGTFDFNTSNFYFKFLSGKLDYMLEVSDFDDFILEYIEDGRWVAEQVLHISREEKQRIYDSLNIVLLPENRFYRYDFFRNNCSTKVIDLILAFTADQSLIDSLKIKSGLTFRKALRPYIAGKEGVNLGINLLLGPFADQPMSKIQQTFLPEGLMEVLSQTKIADPSVIISPGDYEAAMPADPDLPMILFWILLFIVVIEALWSKTSQRTSDRIDAVLFAIPGLLSLLFISLWIWSDHVSLHLNLNLLWANPLNLILVWAIIKNKEKWIKVVAVLYALMLFFLLVNWGRMPQKFPLETMPLVTALVFRAVNRIFKFKKKEKLLASNPQL